MLRQTITRLISSSEAGLLAQGPRILEEINSRHTFNASIAARAQALFSTSPSVSAAAAAAGASDETINVTFTDDKDGSTKTIKIPIGENLLEAAHKNDIDLEGACEGSLACSTCHVIVEDEDYFERIPEPDDDENDMLDLAFGLTDTSRLGCQVKAAKELDGLKVRIPSATRNFAVDGHVPKPH